MREMTAQERFWQGEFGDAYVDRNAGAAAVASNLAFFGRALARAGALSSVLELGTNRGLNLQALRGLLPAAELQGVELNAKACALARALEVAEIWEGSLFDYPLTRTFDLAFTKGVLIHLPPESLPAAYDKLYQASRRLILVGEYYNPSPVEVTYRGHAERLFKRDFAGELLDRYPDLQLLDYGFVYHRDPLFPADDISWFLLEKQP
ncbi:pseudaminic acid biosynthesis-associated methylase [Pseudomonas oryzihabitans]|nr:pseudaminic acid biosynthesis-associated methylase [Pseudomonas psychrotolerans]KTS97078.1 pseudaminic acid biosynthesis-associated methylase [Pseudomonas psychrotolerans]KTT25316.1 pseudaminic acid biosynthesis-associated methylase [Pseudomonas psychrotolerans]KTT38605.1 pseudaminic acid biosynthesis-associated methylase [Pseudomonas psychrotolerans]KTT47154.1 pseudaminic acid biosynthesis-associated methylase [Pseudomonas psychrotolerans]